MVVDIPALAAALARKQDDVEKMIDGYERDGIPAGREPPPRAREPQRPQFVRTHLNTDLSAAATAIGTLLDREPLLCGSLTQQSPALPTTTVSLLSLLLIATEPESPTNPKQQFVDVVMLKRTIDESGKAIRRILDETGILSDVRAIADRFMRERGGDGITTKRARCSCLSCFCCHRHSLFGPSVGCSL